MVAILVALTFVGFILVELVLHRRRAPAAGAIRIRPDHLACPPEGSFVTPNHLVAAMEGDCLAVRPDPFLRKAAGADAGFETVVGGEEIDAGAPLFRVRSGNFALEVAAPFAGRVVENRAGAVRFRPRDLAAAVRSMRIGGELNRWWDEERTRLELFLGDSPAFAAAMPDGGDLAEGYLRLLPSSDVERFRRAFLAPTDH